MTTRGHHGLLMASGGGGSAPHKMWRIAVTANYGYAGTQFGEIKMMTLASDADLTSPSDASSKAFASSRYPGYGGSQAFDDNNTTVWFTNVAPSPGAPQYIGWKFGTGTPAAVSRFYLMPCPTGSVLSIAPKDFRFEWSDDSTDGTDGTWTVEWSVAGAPAWAADEGRTYSHP